MQTLAELEAALLAQPQAVATYPFDPVTLVVKVGGKMFALVGTTSSPLTLSLKVDPDFGAMLCATHAAIAPGYHLNKRHWITVTLDGSLDPVLLGDLIDGSYRLVVRGLSRAVRAELGLV